MAKPKPKSPTKSPRPTATTAAQRAPQQPSRAPQQPTRGPQEVIDPRWLLKMFGIAIAAALVCGYITVGFAFYFTSWQLVLHPIRLDHSGTALPTQHVQFDVDAAGKPRLSGEWYPADPGASRAHYAVLYLRGGDGQLDPADGTQIATLHNLGLNVLAFDYSGYGSSSPQPHPSEKQMLADAIAADTFLARTYNFRDPGQIILFGSGVGASIAAQLAQQFPSTAALIAYNADSEVLPRVRADKRSALYPLALFHDRFSLGALKTLKLPKLLYTVGPLNTARTAVYASAANPKLTVEVPTHSSPEEHAAIARFLDENFPAAPGQLLPH